MNSEHGKSEAAVSPIAIADPLGNYTAHKPEIDAAVQGALAGGRYILGPEVAKFEQEFAQWIGGKECIGVATGTDAIVLALRACGVGHDDLVVTVSNTAVATVAAIELCGAVPVLVDVDPDTFTMDVEKLRSLITQLRRSAERRLKAIVVVHLFGHGADIQSISQIAADEGLMLIEDCAQAHGAVRNGKKIGTFGHAAAFSFYPTKNLGAIGDGGAIVTSDPKVAAAVRLLREYGWSERYISAIAGTNSRLDELQAAILRVKLRYLTDENQKRRDLAGLYDRLLAGCPTLTTPHVVSGAVHVYHQYVVKSALRDHLQARLTQDRIGTSVLYPVPIHLQPAYKGRIRIAAEGLPVTERLAGEILSLPVHPQLSQTDVTRVAERIRAAL